MNNILKDVLAWLKNLERVGDIHTINEDCYWENENTGIVKAFIKLAPNDFVVAPNKAQQCAHIYIVTSTTKKATEDDVNPMISYVRLFHVIPLKKKKKWKKDITNYPYV